MADRPPGGTGPNADQQLYLYVENLTNQELKNLEVKLKADGKEYKGSWTDPKPAAGKHYYYVRATQKDKALAWGSPMWIDSGP